MATQSKAFQREIIATAQRNGTLSRLHWVIEMTWPYALAPGHTSAERHANRIATAVHPAKLAPAIPLGDDPATSRHYAELLAAVFACGNAGRAMSFEPVIADMAQHDDAAWYVWGERVFDNVCALCGQVVESTTTGIDLCEECNR